MKHITCVLKHKTQLYMGILLHAVYEATFVFPPTTQRTNKASGLVVAARFDLVPSA